MQARLSTAQWILERQLAWIAAAEVKVGVIVAIDTALLGGLAAVISTSNNIMCITWFFVVLSFLAIFIGLVCAAYVVLPRTDGPLTSFVFFGRIAVMKVADYTQKFCAATSQELLEDISNQIHRNAEIACEKYNLVTRSIRYSFFGAIVWAISIALITLTRN